jgi:hypothetical protein
MARRLARHASRKQVNLAIEEAAPVVERESARRFRSSASAEVFDVAEVLDMPPPVLEDEAGVRVGFTEGDRFKAYVLGRDAESADAAEQVQVRHSLRKVLQVASR